MWIKCDRSHGNTEFIENNFFVIGSSCVSIHLSFFSYIFSVLPHKIENQLASSYRFDYTSDIRIDTELDGIKVFTRNELIFISCVPGIF